MKPALAIPVATVLCVSVILLGSMLIKKGSEMEMGEKQR